MARARKRNARRGALATVPDRAAAIIPAATVEASRGWTGGDNAALDISRNPIDSGGDSEGGGGGDGGG